MLKQLLLYFIPIYLVSGILSNIHTALHILNIEFSNEVHTSSSHYWLQSDTNTGGWMQLPYWHLLITCLFENNYPKRIPSHMCTFMSFPLLGNMQHLFIRWKRQGCIQVLLLPA